MLDSDTLRELFPHACFHADWRLVTWFPEGVLDNERADRAVEFLESQEKIRGKPFYRYIDMTGYSRLQVGLDHIVRVARRRRRYAGPPVKSAFFAVRLISLSIAHMYEELMERSRIEVCTFRDRAAAAEWLGVPVTILQPPKIKPTSGRNCDSQV
jgi:hypothetical protein